MQLRHDYALCAIDHERTIRRHHRHVAEEHLFFADIFAFGKTKRRPERASIGLAIHERLKIGMLRFVKRVADEIKFVSTVVAGDGEYLLEYRLETDILAFLSGNIRLQKLAIRLRLNLNQVRRRLRHTLKLAEHFAFCTHLNLPFLLF